VYATHIDVYYFCVVKMEKGYTIAVGFVKKVHNRGFTRELLLCFAEYIDFLIIYITMNDDDDGYNY
jgi:hypothetical protein